MGLFADAKPATDKVTGCHVGVISKMVDLGTQEVTYDGDTKYQHKINVGFQLQGVRREGEGDDGKAYNVPSMYYKKYTLSMDSRSALRKFITAVKGSMTDEEASEFDILGLVGLNVMLNLGLSDNGKYVNLLSAMPAPGEPAAVEGAAVVYCINDGPQLPEGLADWEIEVIKTSPEYLALYPADRISDADVPQDNVPPF